MEERKRFLRLFHDKSIGINKDYVIEVSKINTIFSSYAQKTCRILIYKLGLEFDEILLELAKLSSEEYQQLFIFKIEIKTNGFRKLCSETESFKKFLSSFCSIRPIVLILTLENDDEIEIFYKSDNSTKFMEIKNHDCHSEDFHDFPSFLRVVAFKEFRNFEDSMIDKLPEIADCPTIVRFLKTLDLDLKKLILTCIARCSLECILAFLDVEFGDVHKLTNNMKRSYLSYVFKFDNFEISFFDTYNTKDLPITKYFDNDNLECSILFMAIFTKRVDIAKFLISSFPIVLQELKFDHQASISTVAFDTKQFDILNDLLQIADYPFPKNFNFDDVSDKELRKIAISREDFHIAIQNEDLKEMAKFIECNKSLKIVYNIENESALHWARSERAYKSFFHLRSLGFYAIEFIDYSDDLKYEEDKKMKNAAEKQTRKNVKSSISNVESSVVTLTGRSSFYLRGNCKQLEAECREKIMNWLSDLYRMKPIDKIIDFAAINENIEIFFDFNCDLVHDSEFKEIRSLHNNHLILATSNIVEYENNETMRGIIARELCRYVLRHVYENNGKPYYKHDKDKFTEFEEITREIKKISYNISLDKESNFIYSFDKMIANFYKSCKSKNYHSELILQFFQILAQFYNEEDLVANLKSKYKLIFHFIELNVLHELTKFNIMQREDVRKLNKICQVLPRILEMKYKFSNFKDMSEHFNNPLVIITSNVPCLLLLDICHQLYKLDGDLINTNNIFMTSKTSKNLEIVNKCKTFSKENLNLRTFVDCTTESPDSIKNLLTTIENEQQFQMKIIFIVSSEKASHKLKDILNQAQCNLTPVETTINYIWNDLTKESQKQLLRTQINFQNESKYSICDLISNKHDDKTDFSEKFDDQLLIKLVEGSKITVSTETKNSINFDHFSVIFKARNFICKEISDKKALISTLSELELLESTRMKNLIVISDVAGSGTSWILMNITNSLKKLNPMKWTSFVDLKHHINKFKLHSSTLFVDTKDTAQDEENNIDFVNFMLENILETKNDFESMLFSRLYKNGKICILFDGFHEIAPDCTEFIINLIKSFEYKKGNQLWIATREHYEMELKRNLKIDAIYKLDEISQHDGVSLVASYWMLNEPQNSTEIENFANSIVSKIEPNHTPQIYKMVANAFKNNKNAKNLTKFKIYSALAKMHYENFAYYGGDIAKKLCINVTKKSLKYCEIHQFFALKSLFPNDDSFCDLEFEDSGWIDEEVIACGLLTRKNKSFVFQHNGFRDFYAADFIMKYLMNSKFTEVEEFCEIFLNILTMEKSEEICALINDEFDVNKFFENNEQTLKKISKYVKDHIDQTYKFSLKMKNLKNIYKAFIKLPE